MTSANSSCWRTRTRAIKSASPATEYTSVTPSRSAICWATSGMESTSTLMRTMAVITPGSLVELGVNREGTGDGQGPLALDLNQANPGTLQPLQYHLALLV